MKQRLICLAIVAFMTGGTALFAQGKGQGKGKGSDKAPAAQGSGHGNGGGNNVGVNVNLQFGETHSGWIRDYYRPRIGNLPPGLEKQLMRNGTLPPGLQKKLQPFPPGLEGRLPGLPAGYVRRTVGTRAIILNTATNTVVDVIALVGK